MQSTPKAKSLGEIVAEGPASAGTPILAGIFLTSMIPAETSGVNTANPRLKYRISRLINKKTICHSELANGHKR
jgi:hypothetical protein